MSQKIQYMYLLTEYMKYGHLVVVVPVLASYIWDRWWLKVSWMVSISVFLDFIHYLILQTEQNISKLDFILFCGEKVVRCTEVRPLYRSSFYLTTVICHISPLLGHVCVGFAYMINEPSGSDS
jgi:hypothetical protein